MLNAFREQKKKKQKTPTQQREQPANPTTTRNTQGAARLTSTPTARVEHSKNEDLETTPPAAAAAAARTADAAQAKASKARSGTAPSTAPRSFPPPATDTQKNPARGAPEGSKLRMPHPKRLFFDAKNNRARKFYIWPAARSQPALLSKAKVNIKVGAVAKCSELRRAHRQY
jgi:hypothetical protein